MAVISNMLSFREYVALRVIGILIFSLGFLFYGFMAWMFHMEVTRIDYLSWLEFILAFLKYVILPPGFIPLMIGLRFLVLFRSPEEFSKGIVIFIPLFVIGHYVVAVFSAHGSIWTYLWLQCAEIFLAGIVLFKFRSRRVDTANS